MRKVIQIQAVGQAVVALCDDGTMWQLAGSVKGEWLQLNSIPQEAMLRRESDKEFFAEPSRPAPPMPAVKPPNGGVVVVKPAEEGWCVAPTPKCPVPAGTRVLLKFRDGRVDDVNDPEDWRWGHLGIPGDIVAYKIVTPAQTCNCGKVPGNCCVFGSACGD